MAFTLWRNRLYVALDMLARVLHYGGAKGRVFFILRFAVHPRLVAGGLDAGNAYSMLFTILRRAWPNGRAGLDARKCVSRAFDHSAPRLARLAGEPGCEMRAIFYAFPNCVSASALAGAGRWAWC
jgi:hypothetical protein